MSETFKEKKVCLKCGEVYRKKYYAWQIYRNSGIPYAKKEYSILICEDGIFFFSHQGKLNLIPNVILIMLTIMTKMQLMK